MRIMQNYPILIFVGRNSGNNLGFIFEIWRRQIVFKCQRNRKAFERIYVIKKYLEKI